MGEVLAEFAQFISQGRSTEEILARLGDYCSELLPIHGVGVLFRESEGLAVATADTEAGQVVESLEAELGEGPCTECLRSGEQVAVPDLEAEAARYPRFVPAALAAGVRSVHALPMVMRTEQIGSLDLVALDRTSLTAGHLSAGQLLADVAVAYLANSRAFEESTRVARQLQWALDSRVIIEQAKGTLSERHHITVVEAYDRLRRRARDTGRTAREVAADVLRGELDV